MALDEAIWAEAVWVREVVLVAVDGPHVALHPCVFRDEPVLRREAEVSGSAIVASGFREDDGMEIDSPCNNHPESAHAAVHQ